MLPQRAGAARVRTADPDGGAWETREQEDPAQAEDLGGCAPVGLLVRAPCLPRPSRPAPPTIPPIGRERGRGREARPSVLPPLLIGRSPKRMGRKLLHPQPRFIFPLAEPRRGAGSASEAGSGGTDCAAFSVMETGLARNLDHDSRSGLGPDPSPAGRPKHPDALPKSDVYQARVPARQAPPGSGDKGKVACASLCITLGSVGLSRF